MNDIFKCWMLMDNQYVKLQVLSYSYYYYIENLFYIIYKLVLKFYLMCILVVFTETFIFQLFEHYELVNISLINKIWERRNSIIIT